MRVFLFFNTYTVRGIGLGNGHMRIVLPDGVELTHEVIMDIERQTKERHGYDTFIITGSMELDA